MKNIDTAAAATQQWADSQAHRGPNERLVAIDWGRNGLAPFDLVQAISEAAGCTVSGTWFRDENDRMVCHVDYDRRDLRPSHAHGIGYRLVP